jgi:hypothetical protein
MIYYYDVNNINFFVKVGKEKEAGLGEAFRVETKEQTQLIIFLYTVNLIEATVEIIHQFTASYGIILINSIDLQLHQC